MEEMSVDALLLTNRKGILVREKTKKRLLYYIIGQFNEIVILDSIPSLRLSETN
jgi:hypothetical protein